MPFARETNKAYETAVLQVLDGTISDKGILAPMSPSINKPLMRELKEKYGLAFPASLSKHTY